MATQNILDQIEAEISKLKKQKKEIDATIEHLRQTAQYYRSLERNGGALPKARGAKATLVALPKGRRAPRRRGEKTVWQTIQDLLGARPQGLSARDLVKQTGFNLRTVSSTLSFQKRQGALDLVDGCYKLVA